MAPTSDNGLHRYNIASILDRVESAVYLLVSLFLILMALLTFYLVGRDLSLFAIGLFDIDKLELALRDLLTTLIIAELIQTVVVYLKSHQLDIKLVLAAGLTAMIRRILVFGVEKIQPIDMAATGVLLIVLVIAIFLVGDYKITLDKK